MAFAPRIVLCTLVSTMGICADDGIIPKSWTGDCYGVWNRLRDAKEFTSQSVRLKECMHAMRTNNLENFKAVFVPHLLGDHPELMMLALELGRVDFIGHMHGTFLHDGTPINFYTNLGAYLERLAREGKPVTNVFKMVIHAQLSIEQKIATLDLLINALHTSTSPHLVELVHQTSTGLLHDAIAHDDAILVNYLQNKGISAHETDTDGNTAVHTALKRQASPEVVQAAMARADVFRRNAHGQRAEDLIDQGLRHCEPADEIFHRGELPTKDTLAHARSQCRLFRTYEGMLRARKEAYWLEQRMVQKTAELHQLQEQLARLHDADTKVQEFDALKKRYATLQDALKADIATLKERHLARRAACTELEARVAQLKEQDPQEAAFLDFYDNH